MLPGGRVGEHRRPRHAARRLDRAGWTALFPVSTRECYAGVAESSIHVAETRRGRGIGKALISQQVMAAEAAGLWTLQTAIFTENRPSIAMHHAAGYRTVGIRERIAELDGVWHDTVLIERRTYTRQPTGLLARNPGVSSSTDSCLRLSWRGR